MAVDHRLLKQIRQLVDDSLAYSRANPMEMADYMFDLYDQHGRLDRLALFVGQLKWRLTNM